MALLTTSALIVAFLWVLIVQYCSTMYITNLREGGGNNHRMLMIINMVWLCDNFVQKSQPPLVHNWGEVEGREVNIIPVCTGDSNSSCFPPRYCFRHIV